MLDEDVRVLLRSLPSVEELLNHADAQPLLARYSRERVVEAVRHVMAETRDALRRGRDRGDDPVTLDAPLARPAVILAQAERSLDLLAAPSLRRVLNLTGVVIHTNLGRSCLAESAVDRVAEVALGYSTLEFDLTSGGRGSREVHVERLLTRLTGAEAALVVNNNAAAVLLLLSALAAGREVVVSRGQLVEIGGSFRMPDIMRTGGVRLVEVGTTNRTRIADYEAAITPETGMLLRVHTSNFRVMGFVEETGLVELVELGRRRGIPVVDDLGSGAMLELPAFEGEPNVAQSVEAGVDAVCFSGDKLVGGPQAGIILGKVGLVSEVRRHALARALRIDKLTLAALEGTLLLYLDPVRAQREVPTLRFLSRRALETGALANRLLEAIRRQIVAAIEAGGIPTPTEVGERTPAPSTVVHAPASLAGMEVVKTEARAGGGSLPLTTIPSHAVRVEPRQCGAEALVAALRDAPMPVVARIVDDGVILDVLTLEEPDVETAAASVTWALRRAIPGTGSAECA